MLELRAQALGQAANGEVPAVEVQEECSVCGHRGVTHHPADAVPTDDVVDNVIPFPGSR